MFIIFRGECEYFILKLLSTKQIVPKDHKIASVSMSLQGPLESTTYRKQKMSDRDVNSANFCLHFKLNLV